MTRSKLPKGKGWFIWVLSQTLNGDPFALAAEAKDAGLGHVLLHIHDGYLSEEKVPGGRNLTPYIYALRSVGIECWGWGATYATTWSQGADRVIEAFDKHPELEGYVLDGEGPMKNRPNEAMAIMKKLRYYLPDVPIGLSSYRFPKYHPEFPWREFREQCDFDMPQVYWEQSTSVDAGKLQLIASYNQFAQLSPKLPYLPTAPAYKVGGWEPTIWQIKGMFEQAKEMGMNGVNFWVLYQAMRDLPKLYDFIKTYKFDVQPDPPVVIPEYTLEEKVDKLWQSHPELH